MNLFICKARIVTTPRLYRDKQKALTKMMLCLYNNKKSSSFYFTYAQAKGKVAHFIFDGYKKGSFIIIQGSTTIRSKKSSSINKKIRLKKKIIIKIKKVYSVSNNIK
uniref:Putative single-stranded DNA binding protein n=1 Tax=Riquetophycus sp. TaxID=1897556 RepID=A0A1C9C836_9FLOR|nr:putative single-stranded DNA binding protein [Riquetophycus sp.]